MAGHWIWKAAIAGFCGSAAHTLLMYLKSRTGLLPAFQPYENLQVALGRLTGGRVHPLIPWALSFLNGATILGFLFGRVYPWLPGKGGAAKGATFGIFGWVLMGFIFFPLLGLGLFATALDLGLEPALFSLMMLLTYSIVLGVVYAALNSWHP
ncbi:DUF6789 family protein [Bradyrhizobium sp. LMTR 3]|uniref:DUF6789 family protein n=1 Tax=Bradyrhizobium sp. LMTR 3 TaxID=189873 RepID=UPI000810CB4D|nr:DUF6789 family protein [Bradyrhizobium sp. LMTR 3]OCK61229.1 hypothetical protein LMTR3_23725 [Bradyrhizobium sp. LMTR 3]